MSFATLHRGTLLLAAVALTMLTGCAWAPGALALDPFIHHRNYRAAKVAWMTYGQADLGPWAPLCKDFETGWRQGYYDVAGGMDGQRPITPPRRYWAARYQSPAGKKQVEAWFAGYELGAAAAQRDGIGYWAFVPTSLGVPPQERIAEHGTVGYRVVPEDRQHDTLEGQGVPYAEPVPAVEPEAIPRRLPRELPTPAKPPIRRDLPRQAPEPTVETTPPAAEETPAPSDAETPIETAVPEATDDPFAAPAEEAPDTDEALPEAPSMEEGDEVLEPDAAPSDLFEEPSTTAPGEDAEPSDSPAEEVEGTPLRQPIETNPSDQGTGAPAIPRRDLNWPPRPSQPRQPGQRAPAPGELPKGLDTDEPLPDVDDGAAVMRRPPPLHPSSIKTLASRTGSNRLRLAPAPVAPPQADAAEVMTVAAEQPVHWSPRVETALHTAEATAASASEPTGTDQPQAGDAEEADEQAVIEGLRAFETVPAMDEASAASDESGAAAEAPLSEDDLFSGLSTLDESNGE